MKKILTYPIILLVLAFTFTACEEEIERSSTHTDASGSVVGTYTGTISFEDASYSDVIVTFTQFVSDSTQCVSATITSESFNYGTAEGLNLPLFYLNKELVAEPLYFNVSAANDDFLLYSANTQALRTNGRISGSDLEMTLNIKVYKTDVVFHANGDDWTFVGTKSN